MEYIENEDGSITVTMSELERTIIHTEGPSRWFVGSFYDRMALKPTFPNKVCYVEVPCYVTVPVFVTGNEEVTVEKVNQAMMDTDWYLDAGGHPDLTIMVEKFELGDYDYVDRNGDLG
jgi:hypothetical protein